MCGERGEASVVRDNQVGSENGVKPMYIWEREKSYKRILRMHGE